MHPGCGIVRGGMSRHDDQAAGARRPAERARFAGAFAFSTVSSTYEFQLPHSGHFPSHLGDGLPHSWQTYCVTLLVLFISLSGVSYEWTLYNIQVNK